MSPAYVGGGSAGCRVSLLLALRHPEDVRGLLLWSVTGGPVAAERLGYNYYGQFIEAAERGGMAAVIETPFFAERIAQNPSNRERLLAMDPAEFCAVMARWRAFFTEGATLPVIGASEEQLRRIHVPVIIVPGNDEIHPWAVGERLHRLLPQSEFVPELFTAAELEEWRERGAGALVEERAARLARVFGDFLARQEALSPAAR
jgi:pimeloyl-ACP methyl ester carboxylesterase